MAEVKSHEFDGFLKRKPLPVRLFLVYGPDRGLVSERAAALAAATVVWDYLGLIGSKKA